MWGLKLQPQDQESHVPPTEPARLNGKEYRVMSPNLGRPIGPLDNDQSNQSRRIAENVHKAVEGKHTHTHTHTHHQMKFCVLTVRTGGPREDGPTKLTS